MKKFLSILPSAVLALSPARLQRWFWPQPGRPVAVLIRKKRRCAGETKNSL